MVIGAVPQLNTGRLIAVAIHARSHCQAKEQERIAQIRDSRIPVMEWWSFLQPADRLADEPYLPDRVHRHPYAPDLRVDFQTTPRGERFILTGGSLNNQLPDLFRQICRVNTRRFVNLEFHLPLDAIGLKGFDFDKYQYAINPFNRFGDVLQQMSAERRYNSVVFFDGEPLGKLSAQSDLNIFLQWHLSADNLIACLSPANDVH